ncbi:Diaminopimelate epimerase-like protein [Guyanagaster necrorhizus]|uniref:Diaminopimelate epimerase-like protein n=1 Tax=Guyanagaster necrorhizus TaxID=856835 RepID=A0A9P7VHP9_9AGAR|nr:Diaminopimelate epimerase-like protein [Guyanagaster necrorhizus MCA 3950]KAG7440783.1 Diaminopimelate epimerase-like protein [Guyanagaster necrorhizus MCA 3950]
MAALHYTTLDVFTTTPFRGNPLAIVHLSSPESSHVSQQQRVLIAREFSFSETVFVHDREELPDSGAVFPISIFTPSQELPFAGHPTVGAGCYLLSKTGKDKLTLRTKAGDVLVSREDAGVRLKVPVDFKVHTPYLNDILKAKQPALKDSDYVNGVDGAEPVVSIVKGMTFIMVELSSEEALAKLQPYAQWFSLPDEYLGDWKGAGGPAKLYAFVRMADGTIRTRMFKGSYEDPATGSAACALGGWLGQQNGDGNWAFKLVQGIEIGRRSEVRVFSSVSNGEVASVELAGNAVQVMEGKMQISN